jgi:dihydroorotate dehydrogenase (NAD+) catalytic subunit
MAAARLMPTGGEAAGGAATAPTTDLGVVIGSLHLSNPVMPASGCFGPEVGPLLGMSLPGAVVTKTVFAEARAGNRAPRLAETRFGMLNSVGIPSPGSEGFIKRVLPRYQAFGVPVVVSIGGLFTDEYFTIADDLADQNVGAFEVNVSCPNLEHGGLAIGTVPHAVHQVVSGVRERVGKPVIVKLTPTVSSITDVALAAEDAGADALVVANSFSGLGINIDTRASALGNGAGGYTGPAIKPLAMKLVHDAAGAVSIPVIGCGGITTAEDVAEFLIAGATAVQVGTATFTRPSTMNDIIDDLPALCRRTGVSRIADLTGTLRRADFRDVE